MDNPEKLATLCTLDTRRRQTKKNVQYSICWTPPYTRRRQTKPPKNIFDYRNCAILNCHWSNLARFLSLTVMSYT
jgi:hypothetical protein